MLLVNVVNQTAGIFGGDEITTHVEVGPGARVLLSSPSAARFHPSHGRESRLEQTFVIRAGGSLEGLSGNFHPAARLVVLPAHDDPGRAWRGTDLPRDARAGPRRFGRVVRLRALRVVDRRRSAGRLVHRERACIAPRDDLQPGPASRFFFRQLLRGNPRHFAAVRGMGCRFPHSDGQAGWRSSRQACCFQIRRGRMVDSNTRRGTASPCANPFVTFVTQSTHSSGARLPRSATQWLMRLCHKPTVTFSYEAHFRSLRISIFRIRLRHCLNPRHPVSEESRTDQKDDTGKCDLESFIARIYLWYAN